MLTHIVRTSTQGRRIGHINLYHRLNIRIVTSRPLFPDNIVSVYCLTGTRIRFCDGISISYLRTCEHMGTILCHPHRRIIAKRIICRITIGHSVTFGTTAPFDGQIKIPGSPPGITITRITRISSLRPFRNNKCSHGNFICTKGGNSIIPTGAEHQCQAKRHTKNHIPYHHSIPFNH